MERSALQLVLRPLRGLLDDPEITEVCINRPHEAFTECSGGWRRHDLAFADLAWCQRFAKLVAHATHQRVDAESPLLSATLPTGERAQIVLPPATRDDCVSITLRRPSPRTWTLEELAARGALVATRFSGAQPAMDLLAGPTGSGKTTWTKALILEIPPAERLVTIEDACELVLDRHPNHVRLLYSKDGQGLSKVTPKQLLECTLRMRPDRILLAELRGEEAFYYLRNINSGHPGSITSIHAGSPALAFEQLALLVKESVAGRDLSRADIHHLLRQSINIVVQVAIEGGRRVIREIAVTEREV
jgi:type IV secretion system protein VirB11